MRAFVVDVVEKPENNVADVTVRVDIREWDGFKLTAPGGVWGRQRGRTMELTYDRELGDAAADPSLADPTAAAVDGDVFRG